MFLIPQHISGDFITRNHQQATGCLIGIFPVNLPGSQTAGINHENSNVEFMPPDSGISL